VDQDKSYVEEKWGSGQTCAYQELFNVRKAQNGVIVKSGGTEWIFKDLRSVAKWINKELASPTEQKEAQ
jgi:hypothetical protein